MISRFVLIVGWLLSTVSLLFAQDIFEYYPASSFLLLGKGFPESTIYQRLPEIYKPKVRPEVWELSTNSSGIGVRFSSNSTRIGVKWVTAGLTRLPHVSASLVKGLDLYVLSDDKWVWAGLGNPWEDKLNQTVIVSGMDSTWKEFLLYLPMYDRLDSLQIGINKGLQIRKPSESRFRSMPPIVFYGTSITQGASASRPGMAYPSIISRCLNMETINLGFSGNGMLEEVLADIMIGINASCYVLDCGPNLNPEQVTERTTPFIRRLKAAKPDVPILLIEHIYLPAEVVDRKAWDYVERVNAEFARAYQEVMGQGITGVYYLSSASLTGSDGEYTVDGIHLTDLGHTRIAAAIEKPLREILRIR